MPRLKPQYTSDVTPQYKQATAKKRIRYTIAQNVADYPDILTEFNEWKAKKGPAVVPSFAGIFHTSNSLRYSKGRDTGRLGSAQRTGRPNS